MNYNIIFPITFESINPDNDNMDVPFLKPGLPFLFVEKLTETNVRMLVEALMEEDEQLIRMYGDDI